MNLAAVAILGCFLSLSLFLALAFSLAALAILPSPTKPFHEAFHKRTDLTLPFHAFSSSYNLMLIKTSAQGLATYQHKENAGTLLSHSTSIRDMFKSRVLGDKYVVCPPHPPGAE